VGLRRKWCSSDKNKLDFSTKQGSDLIKNDFVTNRSRVSKFGPVELVVVTNLKQLLSNYALFLYRVCNVFVNPEKEDESQ